MTLIFMDGLPTGFDVAETTKYVKDALGWDTPRTEVLAPEDYSPHVGFTLTSGEPITLSRWHVRVVIEGSTGDD